MNNSPLEVTDFSGGMTDDFIAGPLNKGQKFENLLINNNKKAFSVDGSVIRDLVDYQIPAGNKRISYMLDHRTQTFEQSERALYYLESGTYSTLTGPTANPAFSANSETNHISVAFWNNHTFMVSDSFANPIKMWKDSGGTYHVSQAGLPSITAPTVTAGAAGANSYIYAFLYYYTYDVEGVTFEDFGSTVEVLLENAAAPDSNTVAITNIPVIANGATGNYDTTNIKVYIYRTETGQTNLRYIGQVTNGTTSYNDSASDTSIENNELIYTTGDVVDNDPPPAAKFIHIAEDVALYGYVEEDGVELPNVLRQSIKGDPDSCPESFRMEMPQDIKGISSIGSTFIVFCDRSIYRVDGIFDEQGRGGLARLKISDTVGCVSHDSIVQVDNALVFCGNEGFYWTDGFTVQKISMHLNNTYATLVLTTSQARNIFGAYDRDNRRVWWCTQRSESSTDNDSCFILDLRWGISNESTFTIRTNSDVAGNFNPTCLLFRDGNMYRADTNGYVFTHNSDYYTDPKIDLLTTPDQWNRVAIRYRYKSCAYDFGSSFIRKFVPHILLTLANRTNIGVQINSDNDVGRQTGALQEIRYNSNITWGDESIIWGDPLIIWNQVGLIEEKRNFPAGGLRCNYKQIEITNSYTVVTNSDLRGLATVDAGLKTVTMVTAGSEWPADSVDYYVSFEDDNYDTQFLITSRNSDTVLTFSDTANQAPANGNYKWLLKGYRKDEAINILSYVIHYKLLTSSQKDFHGAMDSGANT